MDRKRRKIEGTKGFQEYKNKKRVRELTPEEKELRRIRQKEMNRINEINEENSSNRPINKKRIDRKNKNPWKIFKRVLIVLLTFIIAMGIYAWVNIGGFLSKITNNDMIEATEPIKGDTINILLLGLDIGDPNQVQKQELKRTDTIMVLNYHPKTKKANLVSIPRDTLIKTPKGNNAKINSAYEIGGEEFIQNQIENLLEIEINYMVKVDYAAFRSVIDAIGGVDMYIERDMKYDDDGQNLHINFKGGTTVHLDGKKAEEFFRWRKNNDGTGLAMGDIDRIKNQQLLIKKIIEKCATPSMVLKAPDILNVVAKDVETNLTGKQIVSLGLDFIKMNPSDINMVTLQGEPRDIAKVSYVVFDRDKNIELLDALKNPSSPLTEVKKENVKIIVLNGTKISGLAAAYQIDLKQAGFEKVDVGNTDLTDKSVIMVNDKNIEEIIKKDYTDIKKYDKKDPKLGYTEYDVIIILGKDAQLKKQ